MNRHRDTARILSGLVVASTLVLGAASVSGPALLLSDDGVHYSETLGPDLFDGAVIPVPGDVSTDRFWARNATDEPATVAVFATEASSTLPSDVDPDDDFWVSVVGGEGHVPVAAIDGCVLLAEVPLAEGADRRLELEVGLPFSAGNIAQQQTVSLDLIVTLRPADAPAPTDCRAAPEPPGPPVAPPDPPPLPPTGVDVLPLLALALLLIMLGGVLLVMTRRRTNGERPSAPPFQTTDNA